MCIRNEDVEWAIRDGICNGVESQVTDAVDHPIREVNSGRFAIWARLFDKSGLACTALSVDQMILVYVNQGHEGVTVDLSSNFEPACKWQPPFMWVSWRRDRAEGEAARIRKVRTPVMIAIKNFHRGQPRLIPPCPPPRLHFDVRRTLETSGTRSLAWSQHLIHLTSDTTLLHRRYNVKAQDIAPGRVTQRTPIASFEPLLLLALFFAPRPPLPWSPLLPRVSPDQFQRSNPKGDRKALHRWYHRVVRRFSFHPCA